MPAVDANPRTLAMCCSWVIASLQSVGCRGTNKIQSIATCQMSTFLLTHGSILLDGGHGAANFSLQIVASARAYGHFPLRHHARRRSPMDGV